MKRQCIFNQPMPRFIADAMLSMLDKNAFDSDRVSALNLEYFCAEYLETDKLIDKGAMEVGNMLPLSEEFESRINKATWLPEEISKDVFVFRTPNKQDLFEDLSIRPMNDKDAYKGKLDYYRHSAVYVQSFLNTKKTYALMLLDEIEKSLKNPFNYDNQKKILFCLNELLTGIINDGVDKQYLFDCVNSFLFNNRARIKNENKYVITFLQALIPEMLQFDVVFGINKIVYDALSKLLRIIRLATPNEKKLLKTKYVCHISKKVKGIDAPDPNTALHKAKQSFTDILAAYNLGLHQMSFRALPNGIVTELSRKNAKAIFIQDNSNVLTNTERKSKAFNEKILDMSFHLSFSSQIQNLFSLHNTALLAENQQSQLLNLWTLIEVAIDTNQKNTSRINYITSVLCPILCEAYYFRLIERLINSIKNKRSLNRILKRRYPNLSTTKQFLLYVKNDVEKIKPFLDDNLYMQFQLEKLSKIFSNSAMLLDDYERHAHRLKWQIMRIYRIRCKIVHDGSFASNISSVLENLHYYIDELFDFIITNVDREMYSLDAMFSVARMKEIKIFDYLRKRKTSNIDDDFLLKNLIMA
jgi:hypothetical protein